MSNRQEIVYFNDATCSNTPVQIEYDQSIRSLGGCLEDPACTQIEGTTYYSRNSCPEISPFELNSSDALSATALFKNAPYVTIATFQDELCEFPLNTRFNTLFQSSAFILDACVVDNINPSWSHRYSWSDLTKQLTTIFYNDQACTVVAGDDILAFLNNSPSSVIGNLGQCFGEITGGVKTYTRYNVFINGTKLIDNLNPPSWGTTPNDVGGLVPESTTNVSPAKSGLGLGVILGIVLGAAGFVAIILIIIYLINQRKPRNVSNYGRKIIDNDLIKKSPFNHNHNSSQSLSTTLESGKSSTESSPNNSLNLLSTKAFANGITSYIAIGKHTSQSSQELDLFVNDQITIESVNVDGWGYGRKLTGVEGLVCMDLLVPFDAKRPSSIAESLS